MASTKKKTRCPWLNENNALYVKYHDREWGRAVHNDIKHFEMITLEGAQAGLSWETILSKRENYKRAFSGYDPKKIAKFPQTKIKKLLNNPGIIRNKLKIASVISNAKAFLEIQKEFGSFNKYIRSFVKGKPIRTHFRKKSDYPVKTKISDQISKDLKKRGFKFIGSTTIYAYMQSVGLTQDHSVACFLHHKKTKK